MHLGWRGGGGGRGDGHKCESHNIGGQTDVFLIFSIINQPSSEPKMTNPLRHVFQSYNSQICREVFAFLALFLFSVILILLLKIKNLCTKKSTLERLFKSLSKNEGKKRAALPQPAPLNSLATPPKSLGAV